MKLNAFTKRLKEISDKFEIAATMQKITKVHTGANRSADQLQREAESAFNKLYRNWQVLLRKPLTVLNSLVLEK